MGWSERSANKKMLYGTIRGLILYEEGTISLSVGEERGDIEVEGIQVTGPQIIVGYVSFI